MSLYLKYRPQDFASMVGQPHAIRALQNALKTDSLSHAYLFCGSRGTGKTSLARIVAKALNCLESGEEKEPCNRCELCVGVGRGNMVDLIEIDAASNRGIDEIRDLREKIVFSPTQAKAKVYIIDEVHMLTKEAFNALLKTLEEPPSHAYFILATTEAHKIPETIVSRCQQFSFRRIDDDSIAQRLRHIADQEGMGVEDGALRLIAQASSGGLRDAIGLLEQMSIGGVLTEVQAAEHLGVMGESFIQRFFQSLNEGKAIEAIKMIEEVNRRGRSLSQFATELIGFLRQKMLDHVADPAVCHGVMEWIDLFSQAKLRIGQSSIPQMPLEMAVIKACGLGEGSGLSQEQEGGIRNSDQISPLRSAPFEMTDRGGSAAVEMTDGGGSAAVGMPALRGAEVTGGKSSTAVEMTGKGSDQNDKHDIPLATAGEDPDPRPANSNPAPDHGASAQLPSQEREEAHKEHSDPVRMPTEKTEEIADSISDLPEETEGQNAEISPLRFAAVEMTDGGGSAADGMPALRGAEVTDGGGSTPVEMTANKTADESRQSRPANPDLSLDHIQQHWPQVLDKIPTPYVKMSLMDSRLNHYQDGTISLHFNSTTLMQKVQEPKNQAEVMAVIEEVFQQKLTLKMEVKRIESASLPPASPSAPKDPLVEMAAEVFGVKN